MTDPVTGHLLDYGHTTYPAPKPLTDYLTTRDWKSPRRVCPINGVTGHV
jgi:hypothetical protein